MALFKNILDSMKLTEDNEDVDDYDDYDEYAEQQRRKDEQKQLKHEQKLLLKEQKQALKRAQEEEAYADSEYSAPVYKEPKKEKPVRTNVNKVVPLRRAAAGGFEVCIMKPANFEDSQEICDLLLNGRAAVINLEGYDVEIAQRIMDFISGAVYAVNGRLHQISNYIFIISPDTIDISGDYLDMIQQNGFEIPTFNKHF